MSSRRGRTRRGAARRLTDAQPCLRAKFSKKQQFCSQTRWRSRVYACVEAAHKTEESLVTMFATNWNTKLDSRRGRKRREQVARIQPGTPRRGCTGSANATHVSAPAGVRRTGRYFPLPGPPGLAASRRVPYYVSAWVVKWAVIEHLQMAAEPNQSKPLPTPTNLQGQTPCAGAWGY